MSSKNYIISGNIGFVQSYDFKQNKIYHKYNVLNEYVIPFIIVYNDEMFTKLMASTGNGYIIIWDFHSEQLLFTINPCFSTINSFCKWNNKYIFIATFKTIILLDLINGKIIKKFDEDFRLSKIQKIIHPKYGESLISQDDKGIYIKLWVIKN